ncbi:hydroxyproline dehydrogenase-like isoform X1 [Branchiostoma floridae]|uniref:Proline dehydrogenase n=2 Tax=Branchiostoma floridae TaxID=7739 RepID=A0A9J7MS23_BRAFL|nr:hydroxyproline dehydrogenase-like isoform X1 [Branchiostoma floridae]XP_035678768.1 hydroxyproline dehydrogenase-like isoform X1 [Branchiostoma floridae]XP_035678769.1 hydroxyproline dehydrogenase-like isoform X1 [Branchiostoma floridae]XP_035678770.1 hydroxyproline dehydrogenase-like isoform X1 [Branchiostoma floridae]
MAAWLGRRVCTFGVVGRAVRGQSTRIQTFGHRPAILTAQGRQFSAKSARYDNQHEPSHAVDFGDSTKAFVTKTTWEITRAVLVLQMCTSDMVVDNSLKLMEVGRRILGQTLFGYLMRATFYGQFVGGDTPDKMAATFSRLRDAGIHSMPLLTIEENVGDRAQIEERFYDNNTQYYVDTIRSTTDILAQHGAHARLFQMRLTSFMHAQLLVTLSQHLIEHPSSTELSVEHLSTGLCNDNKTFHLSFLSNEDNEHLRNALLRLHAVCQQAEACNVRMLVDAEYTSMRPAITRLVLAMMYKCNRTRPLVWNTYQCYLKSAYNSVVEDMKLARQLGFCFGIKIVRGAYMEHERAVARQQGYEDPIHCTYDDTGSMYHRVLDETLQFVKDSQGEQVDVIVATHNEDTIKHAIRRMQELGLQKNDRRICFGQQYGMADQISYHLAGAGYAVYKSVPVGPLHTTIAYLNRRAQENRTALRGFRQENRLLWAEMGRRARHPLSWWKH